MVATRNPLVEGILDELCVNGAIVALSDVESGDITISLPDKLPSRQLVPGYALVLPRDAERQTSRLLQLLGRIDGIVNVVDAQLESAPRDNGVGWDEALRGTFHTVLMMSRAVCSQWMLVNGGTITNLIMGSMDHASPIGEAIGKTLVLALTRELSSELAPAIEVNAVVVGTLDPEVERILGDSIHKRLLPSSPSLRTIAQTVVELQTGPRQSHVGTIVSLESRAEPR